MSAYEEETINQAFGLVGKVFSYRLCNVPAFYIVDEKIVGVGYIWSLVLVRPGWFVVWARFSTGRGGDFQKILLVHSEGNSFKRCHSYYIDDADLKKSGLQTIYKDHEIIGSLLNHGMLFDETNCDSCRGENPMQTHYIEVITRSETVEEGKIHGSAEKEDTKDAGKDTEAT